MSLLATPDTPHRGTYDNKYIQNNIFINKKRDGISRDEFILEMHKMKIGVGVHYRSIPEHSVYRKNFGWKTKNYPNAEKIGRETVSIPLSPALKKLEVNKIIQSIKKIFGKYNNFKDHN